MKVEVLAQTCRVDFVFCQANFLANFFELFIYFGLNLEFFGGAPNVIYLFICD